jgi:hypothetical protein
MAVYQGTRVPVAALPGARPIAARRQSRVTPRAHRRMRPVTGVIGVILVALLVGLVFLTQTLQAAVTNYQIDRLLQERQDLVQQLQSQQGLLAQAVAPPAIQLWASQHNLVSHPHPLRVPSR